MRMTPQQIATVAGAVTSSASNPLAGAIVTNALLAIIEDQAEEQERLKSIGEKIDALVEGRYNTGMEYLNQAAQHHRSGERRRRDIEEATRSFMEAYGQERNNLFRKALIEYPLGNCWTLLGSIDDARHWFERAHASVESYLKEASTRVRKAAPGPTNPKGNWSAARSYKKVKASFLEELPAIRDLLDALESLQPAFDLKFSRLPLTQHDVEVWLHLLERGRIIDLSLYIEYKRRPDLYDDLDDLYERFLNTPEIFLLATLFERDRN